jgi:hypothetical protein
MRPGKVLGLSAFLLALEGILPVIANKKLGFPILSAALLMLTVGLWLNNRFSFRIYRGLLWFLLLTSLFLGLWALFSWELLTGYSRIVQSKTQMQFFLWHLFWVAVTGALLYYSDNDHVRAIYHLPSRENKRGSNEEEDHFTS